MDSAPHCETQIGYRLHNEVIIYVDARTGTIYGDDPNIYSYTGYVNTLYEGYQAVDIHYNGWEWFLFGGKKYVWNDPGRRNLALMHGGGSSVSGAAQWNNGDNTWSWSTGKDAYWELEKSFDYFRDGHGVWGPRLQIWTEQAYLDDHRVGFTYNSTRDVDVIKLGPDITGLSIAQSAAQLDIIGHEYTHAMIYHSSRLNKHGEAGAIAEGICDYFGAWIGWINVPGRYTSDWGNGFGWQTGQFARNFVNPAADVPSPASAIYGGSYWNTDYSIGSPGIYTNSGVMRRLLTLHCWGGTFNSVHVNAVPGIERDLFVSMTWWFWSNLNYIDARNAMLGWYDVKYGTCSYQWISLIRAWAAVGVGTIPDCAAYRLGGGKVTTSEKVLAHETKFKVYSVEEQNPNPPIVYSWVLPGSWSVTYNEDHSEITLDETEDYNSRIVSCIITNTDSTYDTVSTFIHFVESPEEKFSPVNNAKENPDDLKIYPNPVKNNLNVLLPTQPVKAVNFEVLDITGRSLYNTKLHLKSSLVTLPDLTPGIYLVKIKGSGNDYVRRITVQ